ncbi:hypothetical protein EVAR_47076_1 [Eumeta japonica]|uniref:Uncharacterized protein n=1 Tax=Eumeta variegata TaxID=151549 RepID=A0A4C1WNL2_EUMVA|nr:hypothetical protein EVAR_47076_1 [Eumeta japonica]
MSSEFRIEFGGIHVPCKRELNRGRSRWGAFCLFVSSEAHNAQPAVTWPRYGSPTAVLFYGLDTHTRKTCCGRGHRSRPSSRVLGVV